MLSGGAFFQFKLPFISWFCTTDMRIAQLKEEGENTLGFCTRSISVSLILSPAIGVFPWSLTPSLEKSSLTCFNHVFRVENSRFIIASPYNEITGVDTLQIDRVLVLDPVLQVPNGLVLVIDEQTPNWLRD
jgi:hypothetical protein